MILFLIMIGIAAGATAAGVTLVSGAGLIAAGVAYVSFGIAAVVAIALVASLAPPARMDPPVSPALRR